MGGTKIGGLKSKAKLLANDQNHYQKIGTIGGKKTRGYAFGHGKVDPKVASKKGLNNRWGIK